MIDKDRGTENFDLSPQKRKIKRSGHFKRLLRLGSQEFLAPSLLYSKIGLVESNESQSIDNQQFELQLELSSSPKLSALLTPEEIYHRLDEFLISQLKEDRRIERKSCQVTPRALGEYFSMWSNTNPAGGVIFVGVDNNGQISGCVDCPDQHLNSIEDSPRIYCPDAKVESRRVALKNQKGEDDFVISFRVAYRPDKVVKTSSGQAYIRSGDKKRELGEEEIREFQIGKGEVHHELEPISMRYPDDFDSDLLKTFARNVRREKGLEYARNIAEILKQQRLGSITNGKFTPNNACCLLFAKDPLPFFPGCRIRFLRFEGEAEGSGENYTLIKDAFIEGPIPKLILETEKILSSQLREFSALDKDGRFYSTPEYPLVAWYEAIVNACAHRSYNLKNMNIFVKMFDDKLQVISPGMLPPMVTPRNIYNMHNPRNPFLMDALRYFRFVKCANEGTRRMKDAMIQGQLPPPKFEEIRNEISGNVTVTFSNNHKQRRKYIDSHAAKNVVSEIIFKTLNEEDIRIINYVTEYSNINISQATRMLSIDWGSAKRKLDSLTSKGILKHKHRKDILRDPKACYTLNPTTKK